MTGFANDPGPETEKLVRDVESRLVEIRRYIHAHPETGFDTIRTAALVAEVLRAIVPDPKPELDAPASWPKLRAARPDPA